MAHRLEGGEVEGSNRPGITLKPVRMIRSIKGEPLGADPPPAGEIKEGFLGEGLEQTCLVTLEWEGTKGAKHRCSRWWSR